MTIAEHEQWIHHERRIHMEAILKSNKGFKNVDGWIDYALLHNFRRVPAEKLEACPDCGGRESGFVGQYVYYSTLVELRSCDNCGLLFSDTRFDPKVIHGHFERAYKDEEYFSKQRRRIFEQITDVIVRSARHGASVLDIGGAKGHLLAMVKQRRPDLQLVLNDLSTTACAYAQNHYGLESVCGEMKTLEGLSRRFDVVILSDVIYYEPELNKLWTLLSRIVSNSGVLIIRVPNLVTLIKGTTMTRKLFGKRQALEMQDSIRFFNPEHLYVLSRRYISRRLRQISFQTVKAVPSALPEDEGHSEYRLCHYLAKIVSFCTFGRIILTPSMIVIAKKQT